MFGALATVGETSSESCMQTIASSSVWSYLITKLVDDDEVHVLSPDCIHTCHQGDGKHSPPPQLGTPLDVFSFATFLLYKVKAIKWHATRLLSTGNMFLINAVFILLILYFYREI